MAGELLFRLFDVDRYHQLLPCLDELASTHKLSDAAVEMLRLALARPKRSEAETLEHASTLKTLDRIIRNRELEPRVFLWPRSLNQAITGLVELLCFEGEYSLVQPVGPSWVVLDFALRALYDLRWFLDIAWGRSPGSAKLAYPREDASFILTRDALDQLLSGLATASRELELDQYTREQVEALIALAARAQSVKRWTLAYSSLM
jgi:hypothetical protein